MGPVKIEEVDGVSVTVSWLPPENDGGANVSGYVVEQRDAHRPGWTTISESVTRPCFKFTRLSEGTEYVFRVAAMNRFGIGGFLQSDVVECKSAKSKFSFHKMFFICTFNENCAAFDNLHCCFENLLLVLFNPTSPTSF